ncbi:MAG TPA: carboxypeptidase regulatory-like domain-containing protein [Paludibacter sp.]
MRTTEKFRINRVLLIAGFILLCNSNFADASAVIKGRVTDFKKQPLNYATATLLNPKTMEIVEGDMCDNKGEFVIENVKPGEYILSVRMLGYAKDESEKIVVDADKNPIVVKNTILNQAAQELNEVVVTARRPMKQQNSEYADITYIKRSDKTVNTIKLNEKKDVSVQTDNVNSDLKNQLCNYVKELQSKNVESPESNEMLSLRSEEKPAVKDQNDNLISGLINELGNYLNELQSINIDFPENQETASIHSEEKQVVSVQESNMFSGLINELGSYLKDLQSINIDFPENHETASIRSDEKQVDSVKEDNMISGLILQLNNYLKELQSKNIDFPENLETSTFHSEVEKFMVNQFNNIIQTSIRFN